MNGEPFDLSKPLGNAQVWNELSIEAANGAHFEAASILVQRALAEYDAASFHANYANILRRLQLYPECLREATKALDLDPTSPNARFVIGCALADQGLADDACDALQYVVETETLFPPFLRFVRAMALLHAGRLKEGFAAYDARIEMRPYAGQVPLWDGKPYKHLAVHAEQGFGDSIMMFRYVRHLKSKVTLGMPEPLVRLFKGQSKFKTVSMNQALPDADAFCPLMSLPDRLGIAGYMPEPYIKAPFKHVLPPLPGFRIGIVWTSKATGNHIDGNEAEHGRRKSIPFPLILELASIPNVQLYSLQTGEAAKDVRKFGARHIVVNLDILDFASMAAWMEELDLVVSVDTAPLHLAGAMGKPAIGLLSYEGSWQWQSADISPWYPTINVCRQDKPNDWRSCLAKARAMIEHML